MRYIIMKKCVPGRTAAVAAGGPGGVGFWTRPTPCQGYKLILLARHTSSSPFRPAFLLLPTCSPEVEFCGYSAPHPSEPKIHLRVQMYGECERASGAYSAGESTALIPDASVSPACADGKSAIGAVRKALDDLETIFLAIDKKYKEDVEKGDYDTYEEQFLDLKQVRAGITTRQPVKTEAGQGDEDAEMDTA